MVIWLFDSSSRISGRMKDSGIDWREHPFAFRVFKGEEGKRSGKEVRPDQMEKFDNRLRQSSKTVCVIGAKSIRNTFMGPILFGDLRLLTDG